MRAVIRLKIVTFIVDSTARKAVAVVIHDVILLGLASCSLGGVSLEIQEQLDDMRQASAVKNLDSFGDRQ